MAKINTSIKIDPTLRYQAQAMGINISQLVNNVLEGIVNKNNSQEVDITEIRKDITKIDQDMNALVKRRSELMSIIVEFEAKLKNNSNNKLKDTEQFVEGVIKSGTLGMLGD